MKNTYLTSRMKKKQHQHHTQHSQQQNTTQHTKQLAQHHQNGGHLYLVGGAGWATTNHDQHTTEQEQPWSKQKTTAQSCKNEANKNKHQNHSHHIQNNGANLGLFRGAGPIHHLSRLMKNSTASAPNTEGAARVRTRQEQQHCCPMAEGRATTTDEQPLTPAATFTH